MLYENEIAQLNEQLRQLELLKDELEKLIDHTSNKELMEIYQKEIEEISIDIDEIKEAIEILQNKQHGSPNGFDEHSSKIDWSNPDNWSQIRGLFGFDDEPGDN